MGLYINVKNKGLIVPQEVLEAVGRDELIARLFINRGYTDPDIIREMLGKAPYKETSPHEFPSMQGALNRIDKAIKRGEKICVYGDYDVDGVTSTVVLVETLRKFANDVVYHVPDRFSEGYGMNIEVVKTLKESGVSLIVTCDCGISNVEEVQAAKDLGMDVIVTDHHNIPETLPAADVILNPKLLPKDHPAYNISGCAVGYFLACAILDYYGQKGSEDLLDMVGLSLVADVVPLNGENRSLLKKALPKVYETKRAGLYELMSIAGLGERPCTEEDIAFQIAPRVNAAGRMDSARLPVELFLCQDAAEAKGIAAQIDMLNMQRKKMQAQMIEEAEAMVEPEMLDRAVLVLYKEDWHHGIIGIAAGRLCEKYRKPVIMMSAKEDLKTAVGSARSVEGIDIYELIKTASGKLLKFGGHTAAAGLSLLIEDVQSFIGEITECAANICSDSEVLDALNVDAEIPFSEVDEMLYNRLLAAGPYGEGFEPPTFASKSVQVLSDRKTDKNHHIMVLADDKDFRVSAVKWFGEDYSLQGKVLDIVYSVGINSFNQNSSVQLTISYMEEMQEKSAVAIEKAVFVDRRGEDLSVLMRDYGDAVVFFEGLEVSKPRKGNIVDRYTVSKTDKLVFASLPASGDVLREAVARANPSYIIVNLSVLPDYSFNGFITNFAKTLKYVINNLGGRVNAEELSAKLCVEQPIVYAAFKYLIAIGKLSSMFDYESGWVYIETCAKEPDKAKAPFAEKALRSALAEKEAYKQFVYKMDINKWEELCNGQRN